MTNPATFGIEQVALAVEDIKKSVTEWARRGFNDWVRDTVTLEVTNYDTEYHRLESEGMAVAHLAFSYQVIPDKEFELIEFVTGHSFHDHIAVPAMSHMGLHVPSIPVFLRSTPHHWPKLMEARTISHTNPAVGATRYK